MSFRTLSIASGMAFRALRLSPLRTALSTLGVVVGVAALVAVLAVGDGVERFGRDQLERTTDLHAVMITPVTTRMVDRQRIPRSDYPVFSAASATELATRLPAGTIVSAGVSGSAVWLQDSGKVRGVLVQATDPAALHIATLTVAEGRFFTEQEESQAASVVVISRELADTAGARLGARLMLGGASLEVVGILEARDREDFLRALVPLSIAQQVFAGQGPRAPSLSVKAAAVEEVPGIRTAAEGWLAERYGDWQGRATVLSNQARVTQARQGLLIFKILMGAITGISLIVGGIGIMNVLLASVVERTREIGVRRATGASRRDILAQFLLESLAVTGAGSLLGIALGLAGAFGVTALMRARTEALLYAAATWTTVLVAVLAGVLVGLVFGLYPALRAARLSPIEAIRHE